MGGVGDGPGGVAEIAASGVVYREVAVAEFCSAAGNERATVYRRGVARSRLLEKL